MNQALSECKDCVLTTLPHPLFFLNAGVTVWASVGGRARAFLGGWAGGYPLPWVRGQGSGCYHLNNMQQPLCSWAMAAFVPHMMVWLPFSPPERAIQPSFITTRCAGRKET